MNQLLIRAAWQNIYINKIFYNYFVQIAINRNIRFGKLKCGMWDIPARGIKIIESHL